MDDMYANDVFREVKGYFMDVAMQKITKAL